MVLKENVQPIEIAFNLTESGLNVFTQVELQLPTVVGQNLVFDIDIIELFPNPPMDPVAAGEVSQAFQVTLQSQSAILQWEDSSLVAATRRQAHASAALLANSEEIQDLHMDTRGRANLISTDSIFVGIDSVNTTLVTQWQGRIVGSLVKLSPAALTQLVLSQLS